jgi:hypothetical protein
MAYCTVVEAVLAWHVAKQEMVLGKLLECKTKYSIEYRTSPEGLHPVVIELEDNNVTVWEISDEI